MRGNRGAGRRWGWSEQFKRTRFPSISFSFLHFPFNVVHFEILVISYCPCRLLFRESQLSVSEKGSLEIPASGQAPPFIFLPLLISEESDLVPVAVGTCPTMVASEISMLMCLHLPTASQVPANLIPVPSHDSAQSQLMIICLIDYYILNF